MKQKPNMSYLISLINSSLKQLMNRANIIKFNGESFTSCPGYTLKLRRAISVL